MLRLFLAAIAVLISHGAMAQLTIAPSQRTSIPVSGTITTGNTFQSIMGADGDRTGCTIQNTSLHTMYVYFGDTANATTSNSLQVAANGMVNCNSASSIALTDNVAITTSTTGDTFVAFYQH